MCWAYAGTFALSIAINVGITMGLEVPLQLSEGKYNIGIQTVERIAESCQAIW